MNRRVWVGLIGSRFISTIHAESLRRSAEADLWAVASPTPGNARQFAARHAIAHHFTDYKKMLEMDELDMVVIGVPNDLHCAITLDAAAAGKHVVVEKPLALNLAQAERMIEACRRAKVKLMYAEELCFAPKYVRLKELLVSGALGAPLLLKQSEKHDGPHADHFWDVERSGGGVTMDMGCHAIEFFRWMLDRPKITSVYAQMSTSVHAGKTKGDDNAILILEFENGVTAMAEESWTKLGGMDDRAEVHGSRAWRTPICYKAIRSLPTAPPAMTTRWKKPARPGAGVSRSTKSCGITAFRKNLRTLSTASKTTSRPKSPARMGVPCSRR